MKKTNIALFILIVITIGVFIFWRPDNRPIQPLERVEIHNDVSDWTKGKQDGSIELVEFSDFQCPACRTVSSWILEALEKWDEMSVVYKHFPLAHIHINAVNAARAAEAAGRQGKFWEMHDILFSRQEEWADAGDALKIFSSYAEELGLERNTFQKDFLSQEVQNKIESDFSLGLKIGVNATPTFFLNGKRLPSTLTKNDFFALLEKEIALERDNKQ